MNQIEEKDNLMLTTASYDMSMSSYSCKKSSGLKHDSFKIFNDEYWQKSDFSTALNHHVVDQNEYFYEQSEEDSNMDYFEYVPITS